MSESAPRDNTDAPSGCGDAGCDKGELSVNTGKGYDKGGRENPFVKNKIFIRNTCLLCANALAVKSAI